MGQTRTQGENSKRTARRPPATLPDKAPTEPPAEPSEVDATAEIAKGPPAVVAQRWSALYKNKPEPLTDEEAGLVLKCLMEGGSCTSPHYVERFVPVWVGAFGIVS